MPQHGSRCWQACPQLDIKNLILYHTEEMTIDTRKQTYTQEAAQFFKGRIVVPDDLEEIGI